MRIKQAAVGQSVVTLDDYSDLLKIRALPDYRFVGRDRIEAFLKGRP